MRRGAGWNGIAPPPSPRRRWTPRPTCGRRSGVTWRTQGWLGLHVDEALGGEGYGLPELAVVLEELGRACAPGPFLPTVLAAAVVQAAGKETAAEIVPGLASGETVGTVAVERSVDAEPAGDGLRVRGTLRAVPRPTWRACSSPTPATTGACSPRVSSRPVNCRASTPPGASPKCASSTPWYRVRAGSTVWMPSGCATWRRCCSRPRASASRSGASTPRRSTPKVRVQFGRPIGQFQGVKHRCADMLGPHRARTRRRVGRGARRRRRRQRRRARDRGRGRARARRRVPRTRKDCVQMLGGIGFTWEHDAHLYLRRAIATAPARSATPDEWRVRAARSCAGRRPAPARASTCRPKPRRIRDEVARVPRRGQGRSTPQEQRRPARRRGLPHAALAAAVGARRRRRSSCS